MLRNIFSKIYNLKNTSSSSAKVIRMSSAYKSIVGDEGVSLDKMSFTSCKSVQMKNRKNVQDIMNKMKEGGCNKLQVIADFDRTLTIPYLDGKETLSSFGIFNLSLQLPKEYQKLNGELFNHYRPIEVDPNIDIEKKSVFMEEWLQKKSDLLHFELDKNEINEAVAKANVVLREKTDTMFQLLTERQVPVLVFSAGLGDTIQGVLKLQNLLTPNVHVISNFLKFNGNKVCGLQSNLIHTFNKNERAIRNTEYFNELQGKENVLLIGDSLGDVGMADGVKDANAVLKIGFLQEHVEENLPAFMEEFDIVLIHDFTMNVINEIIRKII